MDRLTVLLGWIKTATHLLKPFVRNRVAEIQDSTDAASWFYVKTNENPADVVSRGMYPSMLQDSKLWWFGPNWLTQEKEYWPKQPTVNPDLPEIKTTLITYEIESLHFPFEIFSNLNRMQRCCAYMLRFIKNCHVDKNDRIKSDLTAIELDKALKVLCKIVQNNEFIREIETLKKGESVHCKSKLLCLNPFLDNDGLIRVGGRLENSDFPYDKKHPVLLPAKHALTKLIFESTHKTLLHAGPQQLLYQVREQFWPLSGRKTAKLVVRECVKCFRFKAQAVQPIMGNLPASRMLSGFPFQVTGLDYAGPFQIRDRKGRGCKLYKGYVCLFVCFATKCLHLELVSDLTTQTFLLALKRFIARRGKPSHIYSDNGTTFVGANRELERLAEFLKNNTDAVNEFANNKGIQWHFAPPYAPNFGGLWEAGVKSTKHHMKRVIGNAHLTFEEFTTILSQIEAILNSRPLCPLSSDPSDPLPLTPAHFLIGRTLSSITEPDVTSVPENRLTNYQNLDRMRQHFWTRWRKDFISELQQRTKWRTTKSSLVKGALVLLKDDNVPPMEWSLGRVLEIKPGKDDIARVASIKTSKGVVVRAVTKICPLPIETDSC